MVLAIGDLLRRVIGRGIVKCFKPYLQVVGEKYRQKSGIEQAVHALIRRSYEDQTGAILLIEDHTGAILLIEVRNLFSSLNRDSALKNIRKPFRPI